jgi:hypothetical protein
VNLLQETDVLWSTIRKDQRDRIKRLERKAVVLSEGVQWEDLKGLKMARESTQARRTSRNQGYKLTRQDELYSYV